jgi:hypothetical protein
VAVAQPLCLPVSARAPRLAGEDAEVPPYVYVLFGVAVLALLWVVFKFWRVIVGLLLFLIIAVGIKVGFALLGHWLS